MSKWKKPQKNVRLQMEELRQEQAKAKKPRAIANVRDVYTPNEASKMINSAPPFSWQFLSPSQLVVSGGQFWTPISPKPAVDLAKLEALKAVEPHRVARPMPDYIQVIPAWRAWKVTGGCLASVGQSHVWEPKKKIEAQCVNGRMYDGVASHCAPCFDCDCGVWAFKELDGLVSAIQRYEGLQVLGTVSLWGRVIETENGYRAQYAYPSELWLLDDSLEELGLIYDVPVRTIPTQGTE